MLVVPRAGPPRAAGGSWERGWTRCTSSCGAEAVQSMGASIPKAQHVASRRMGRGKQSRGSEDGPDLERGRCWLHMQGDPVRSESAMRARGRDGGPFLPRGAAVGRALPVPGSPGSPPPPATTPGRRLAPFPPLSSFPAAPGMTHFRGGGRQPAHSRALAPAAPRARSPTGSAAHPGGRRAAARSSRPSRRWQRLERCGGRTPHRPPPPFPRCVVGSALTTAFFNEPFTSTARALLGKRGSREPFIFRGVAEPRRGVSIAHRVPASARRSALLASGWVFWGAGVLLLARMLGRRLPGQRAEDGGCSAEGWS